MYIVLTRLLGGVSGSSGMPRRDARSSSSITVPSMSGEGEKGGGEGERCWSGVGEKARWMAGGVSGEEGGEKVRCERGLGGAGTVAFFRTSCFRLAKGLGSSSLSFWGGWWAALLAWLREEPFTLDLEALSVALVLLAFPAVMFTTFEEFVLWPETSYK